jgi:hypothetical protein
VAKILEFKRVAQQTVKTSEMKFAPAEVEDDISAVVNDYSLTPANRRWILENMLMNIDERLEEYKKELEKAERKLDALVKAAEKEISAAYSEFHARVGGMTDAVKKLTRASRSAGSTKGAATAANTGEHPGSPQ